MLSVKKTSLSPSKKKTHTHPNAFNYNEKKQKAKKNVVKLCKTRNTMQGLSVLQNKKKKREYKSHFFNASLHFYEPQLFNLIIQQSLTLMCAIDMKHLLVKYVIIKVGGHGDLCIQQTNWQHTKQLQNLYFRYNLSCCLKWAKNVGSQCFFLACVLQFLTRTLNFDPNE